MAAESLTYKRDASIVMFDAWFGGRFADNPRFLFQYLNLNKDKYGLKHVIWVSRSKEVVKTLCDTGYEAYLLESEESIRYHKCAKYLICNNAPVTEGNAIGEFLGRYSFRARKINLWHGVGVVKGVWFESNEYKAERSKSVGIHRIKEFLHTHVTLYRKLVEREGGWGDCYYVAPTVEEREKLMRYLLLPPKRFIPTGYARNCNCIQLLPSEKAVDEILRRFKHTIIYMPTFKTGNNDFDFRTIGPSLKTFLMDNDILWIHKGHSADKYSAEYDLKDNVLSLTSDFDTNVIVPNISILITDYSSAMMDALAHDKPVLLFAPDYDIFVNGERGLLPDANIIMSGCGYIYKDIDSLKSGILKAIENPNEAKPANYYETRKMYWGEEKSYDNIWKDIVKSVG